MKQGEKGFTYIELVLAAAIIVLISSAVAIATFQVFKGSERNNNHMTAVRQVQNTGYWIGNDTRMAQVVTVSGLTPPNFLILNWTKANTGDEYQVAYTLENMPGGELKRLFRNQSINGEGNSTTLVAMYIDTELDKTRCEFANGKLTLTITATVGKGAPRESESRTYKLVPRPG